MSSGESEVKIVFNTTRYEKEEINIAKIKTIYMNVYRDLRNKISDRLSSEGLNSRIRSIKDKEKYEHGHVIIPIMVHVTFSGSKDELKKKMDELIETDESFKETTIDRIEDFIVFTDSNPMNKNGFKISKKYLCIEFGKYVSTKNPEAQIYLPSRERLIESLMKYSNGFVTSNFEVVYKGNPKKREVMISFSDEQDLHIMNKLIDGALIKSENPTGNGGKIIACKTYYPIVDTRFKEYYVKDNNGKPIVFRCHMNTMSYIISSNITSFSNAIFEYQKRIETPPTQEPKKVDTERIRPYRTFAFRR